ncbi:MAG TPA: chemotaxis protein CheB, partial [Bacteroidales bacterium]|nr:chemotaxis protein CheB [Bacteroidales bacterium]
MKLPDNLIDNSNDAKKDQFPIVGIGTSAGGLEALDEFFLNTPENTGMAFIVIQHLAPDHKGILSELIQRVTKMKVYTVSDRMKVKPNCVYVIPSNKSMSIYKGTLHLFKSIKTNGLRLPIDFFFRSLADDQHVRSVGIVLSGMGSDGSMGLKAIKEKSGMVLVQDPESAKFDSMPRHAIDSVMVDIVAHANEIPSRLIGLVRHPPVLVKKEELEKDTSSLEKIIILLRNHTGNDFSEYKKNTIYRRIERRMGVHQLKKIASYVRYLQETPAEVEILFKELLIGVTNFFRDPAFWDELKDKIFPSIFEKLPKRYILRIWIPGCSTGEEAYSMAMVFKEALEKANLNKNISLQIFATDLDIDAIEKARKGIYPPNIVNDVSSGRLSRFFTKTDNHYKVNPEIREIVVFASQNLIKDPPFTKLNLVSCRNLLIYLDSPLQKRLMSLFHYTLNTDGYLLLGSAETNGTIGNLFTSINSKLRIYQRAGISEKEDLSFQGSSSHHKPGNMDNKSEKKIEDNIQVLTDQILLQQYSPASVLTTNKGDILYLTGDIGKYLAPAAGKANMNMLAMAREGLRNELPGAFRKALQSFEKVILSNIKLVTNGRTHLVTVSLNQLEKPP